MTSLSVLDEDQVGALIGAVGSVSWPVSTDAVTTLVSGLGWTPQYSGQSAAIYATGYAISTPRANASFSDGVMGQLSVDASDRIAEKDRSAEGDRALATAAKALRDEVASSLGAPVRSKGGANARYTWDLSNRGRVAVAKLAGVVQVIVLQQRYADLERREEGLGIPDDRDPDDSANDLV